MHTENMRTHIRIVAILHIVFGAIGIVIALGMFAVLGGVAALAGINDRSGEGAVAAIGMGALGAIMSAVIAIISVPSIIAGIGMLYYKPWARLLGIIISAVDLFNVPIGTAIGLYGLWALLSREGAELFRAGSPSAVPQPYMK